MEKYIAVVNASGKTSGQNTRLKSLIFARKLYFIRFHIFISS